MPVRLGPGRAPERRFELAAHFVECNLCALTRRRSSAGRATVS
jgi:hypothetical protein